MIALILQILGILTFWAMMFVSSLAFVDRYIERNAEPWPVILVCSIVATAAAAGLWWVS